MGAYLSLLPIGEDGGACLPPHRRVEGEALPGLGWFGRCRPRLSDVQPGRWPVRLDAMILAGGVVFPHLAQITDLLFGHGKWMLMICRFPFLDSALSAYIWTESLESIPMGFRRDDECRVALPYSLRLHSVASVLEQ